MTYDRNINNEFIKIYLFRGKILITFLHMMKILLNPKAILESLKEY